MMKKLLPILIIGVIALSFTGRTSKDPLDYCAKNEAKAQAKVTLKPYRYAGTKSKPFYIKEYHQRKETVIELLYEVPYRIVFYRNGLPEGQMVDISIYDEPYGSKHRELIYRDEGGSEELVFDTKEDLSEDFRGIQRLYIEYFIHPFEGEEELDENVRMKGCVVMTHGYQNKWTNEDLEE